jgi:type I restriction enzyme S subunit
MEVKAGHKRTEAGIIPEDWDVEYLADIATIQTGPFGTLLKASEYAGNEGVPLISVGEIGLGNFRITAHTPRVPAAVVRRLPQYLLRAGDIVFGRKGAVERSALVTTREEGWFLGSDGIRVRPQRECHAPYLACQFQRHEVQSWLLQNATGTTMASLNQSVLGRLQIPYAPVREQRAIAAALNDVEALLGAQDRLIAKKRDLKQAAMQQLLTGQTRLPGFTDQWKTVTLGSLGQFHKGAGVKKDDAKSGELACIRYGEIYTRHHDVIREFSSRISIEVASGATCLRSGDILFAASGETKAEIGKAVAFIHDCEAYAGGDILILRPSASDATFLGYYLNSSPIQLQKASRGQGDAVVHISASSLAAIALKLPDATEQAAIGRVLVDMDAELSVLEQRHKKTRALKQGMMQELLTGRTRLVSPEIADA